jgi:hypothetical protein
VTDENVDPKNRPERCGEKVSRLAHPCDATPAPLSSDKILPPGINVTGFQRRRADHAISFADHLDGLAFIQITTDGAIRKISLAVHEARSRVCKRLGTAQHLHGVLLRAADEREQIRIKAVSILFPLAFLEDCSKIPGTQLTNQTQSKQELRQLVRLRL